MTDLDLPEILDRYNRAVEYLASAYDLEPGPWRVTQSDSESIDAIVPVCQNPRHNENAERADMRPEWFLDEDCCPTRAIETFSERLAAFLAAAFTDVPALAAEVERLRAEVANTQPSTLAETLRDAIRALDIYTCEEADRIAAPVIKEAQEAATATKAWREAEVEQERQRSAALVAETRREIEVQERHVDRAKAEAAKARAALDRVKYVQVWTNEDGKKFVFADDLAAAINGQAETNGATS